VLAIEGETVIRWQALELKMRVRGVDEGSEETRAEFSEEGRRDRVFLYEKGGWPWAAAKLEEGGES